MLHFIFYTNYVISWQLRCVASTSSAEYICNNLRLYNHNKLKKEAVQSSVAVLLTVSTSVRRNESSIPILQPAHKKYYAAFKAFTGFDTAAFIVWKITVSIVMNNTTSAGV